MTEYSGAWTYESCLPVYNIYNSNAQYLNTHTRFYNITIGRLINIYKKHFIMVNTTETHIFSMRVNQHTSYKIKFTISLLRVLIKKILINFI